MRKIALQIYDRIKRAHTIVIVAHQNADGDALGSACALFEHLQKIGLKTEIFCLTPLNPKLAFLPHSEKLQTNPEIFSNPDLDTIIVLDSGDLQYAGIHSFVKNHSAEIINIDHHHTNQKYGHLNLVNPTASSTAEIVYNFLRHVQVHISHRMATALLTGIITDTDNFTNSATSDTAMAAAGDLIRKGGNLNMINEQVVRNKSINLLRLWGEILNRLNKHEALDMVYTYITQVDLKVHQVDETDSEGIANFLNNLDEGKMSLILKETQDGKIKGSFRTTKDDVDVSALAKKLGGGGHKKAAGFSIAGTIDEVMKKITTL
ncbi:MAG: bifunctional oligoribonuclease/PAP phosphatase NrnA [Candidatus Magasanikbacteria bacterium]